MRGSEVGFRDAGKAAGECVRIEGSITLEGVRIEGVEVYHCCVCARAEPV